MKSAMLEHPRSKILQFGIGEFELVSEFGFRISEFKLGSPFISSPRSGYFLHFSSCPLRLAMIVY